ncbi:spermatogenesis-associated protein 1 [Polyodon spathula]|uniref:spermatogenesis-associated protein 1 n=1 Tax=Polyodon spathula TaxID=7913 RepID=UPI001B7F61DD|nr:spermatogenesis-associated protein 1 [Polyodon spathula]
MNRLCEEKRPPTAALVELHVFYVPEDQWNSKLNRVPTDAIDTFISAGFIRVCPDLSLRTLRGQIAELLGEDAATEKFAFLKYVGRSLALVKAKQERELKVKSFAPPYAPQPELYLLPGVENDRSVYSVSLTPDRQNFNSDDAKSYGSPKRTSSLPTEKRQASRLPRIHHRAPQKPPIKNLEDSVSLSWEEEEEEQEETRPSQDHSWNKETDHRKRTLEQQLPPIRKKADKPSVPNKQARNQKSFKDTRVLRNNTRDSGVPESLEDRDTEYLQNQSNNRKIEESAPLTHNNKKRINQLQVKENPLPLPTPAQYTAPPTPPLLAMTSHKPKVPVFLTDRDQLIEQMKLAKQERKQLKKARRELVKKAKGLLAQNHQKRKQARDAWKKRYFETKKATAPLEDTLKTLRQELETYYQKLVQQLQARDGRKKHKHPMNTSNSKNGLVIQITTEQREIDELKRKVDDAKMKLVTELKLRKQAATELRALRAELTQKKAQSSLASPHQGSALQNLRYQAGPQRTPA